ncbi:hypothetical protein T12_2961, partial [Trichinella patagoniensis]
MGLIKFPPRSNLVSMAVFPPLVGEETRALTLCLPESRKTTLQAASGLKIFSSLEGVTIAEEGRWLASEVTG